MNKILFVCQLLLGCSLSQDEEIVEDKDTEIIYTGSGPIRGKERDIQGKTHYEFLGIPYAQPPVGKLRFIIIIIINYYYYYYFIINIHYYYYYY